MHNCDIFGRMKVLIVFLLAMTVEGLQFNQDIFNQTSENCIANNGTWSSWSDCSLCSTSCGTEGLRYRRRKCLKDGCLVEVDEENEDCKRIKCPEKLDYYTDYWQCFFNPPTHGEWTSWAIENDCTSLCPGNIKYSSRQCESPTPKFCGNFCGDENLKLEICRGFSVSYPSKSCKVIKENFPSTTSGFYWVQFTNVTKVYCDMETDGGGWTLIGNLTIADSAQTSSYSYEATMSADLSRLGDAVQGSFLLSAGEPLKQLENFIEFSSIRIYCSKTVVPRTVHMVVQLGEANCWGDYLFGSPNVCDAGLCSYVRFLSDDNSLIAKQPCTS